MKDLCFVRLWFDLFWMQLNWFVVGSSMASQQRSLPNLLKSNGEVKPPEEPFGNTFALNGEHVNASFPLQLPLQQQPPRRSGLKQPTKRTAMPSAKSGPGPTSCSKEPADFSPNGGAPAPKVTSLIPRPNTFSRIRPPSKWAPTQVDHRYLHNHFYHRHF